MQGLFVASALAVIVSPCVALDARSSSRSLSFVVAARYSSLMGYTQWRERQNARIDAMTARADERAQRAKEHEQQVRAEVKASKVQRATDAEAAQLEVFRARAHELGEDHDDLMRRAVALGIGGPVLPDHGGLIAMVGEVIASEATPAGTKNADPYQLWWGRILEEERCAAKVARGGSLSLLDRARLRFARIDP